MIRRQRCARLLPIILATCGGVLLPVLTVAAAKLPRSSAGCKSTYGARTPR